MKISIIGVGLLGGSFALGLRSVDEAHHFIGVDTSEENCIYCTETGYR